MLRLQKDGWTATLSKILKQIFLHRCKGDTV